MCLTLVSCSIILAPQGYGNKELSNLKFSEGPWCGEGRLGASWWPWVRLAALSAPLTSSSVRTELCNEGTDGGIVIEPIRPVCSLMCPSEDSASERL